MSAADPLSRPEASPNGGGAASAEALATAARTRAFSHVRRPIRLQPAHPI
jgi:hypothetical protein